MAIQDDSEQDQIDDREQDFQNVLVQWRLNSIGVKVHSDRVRRNTFVHDIGMRIRRRLHYPTSPEPLDTTLVS